MSGPEQVAADREARKRDATRRADPSYIEMPEDPALLSTGDMVQVLGQHADAATDAERPTLCRFYIAVRDRLEAMQRRVDFIAEQHPTFIDTGRPQHYRLTWEVEGDPDSPLDANGETLELAIDWAIQVEHSRRRDR